MGSEPVGQPPSGLRYIHVLVQCDTRETQKEWRHDTHGEMMLYGGDPWGFPPRRRNPRDDPRVTRRVHEAVTTFARTTTIAVFPCATTNRTTKTTATTREPSNDNKCLWDAADAPFSTRTVSRQEETPWISVLGIDHRRRHCMFCVVAKVMMVFRLIPAESIEPRPLLVRCRLYHCVDFDTWSVRSALFGKKRACQNEDA